MRRTLPLVFLLAALVACSDGSTDTSGADGSAVDTDGTDTGDTGDTGTAGTEWVKPSVEPPETLPSSLVVTDLREGSGPAAAEGDEVVVHYVGVLSADGTEFDNSYDSGAPFMVTIGAGTVIQGWDEGLVGVQQGGRRRLDIPADLAYGDTGSGEAIPPGAPITFIVDVVAVLPLFTAADAPDVEVEAAGNIAEVTFTELQVGDGAGLADGDTAVVHMVLYRADTGELLTASWGGPPLRFGIGANTEVFPGIHTAVQGMRVGGRRQAQIPFGQVFDGAGNTNVGLPPDVDLVAVFDLITVF